MGRGNSSTLNRVTKADKTKDYERSLRGERMGGIVGGNGKRIR